MRENEEDNSVQEQSQAINEGGQSEMDTQQSVANTAAPQQQSAPAPQQQAAPVQQPAPPAVQQAPALAGGQQQAGGNTQSAAATTATGAGGSSAGVALAPPVTAGATGGAAPSDSGSSTAGAGGGSDAGGAFTIDGVSFASENWKDSIDFLGNSIALAKTAFKAINGEDVTAQNIAIPTVANKFISLSNAKIDSITFNKNEGLKEVKISAGTVAMGGGKLFYSEGLQAELKNKDGNYTVTLAKTIINGFGNKAPIGVGGAFLEINGQGQLIKGGAPVIEQQGFKIEGLEITQEALTIQSAQVVLPKLGNNNLDLVFKNVSASNGMWNFNGEVKSTAPDGSLSFLNDKLKLNQLSSNLKLQNNVFSGTISSPFEYQGGEGASLAKANGLGTITVGATSSFQIANGKAEASLGGMQFLGEGLELKVLNGQQTLAVTTGTVKVPSLNKDFKVTIEGGSIDSVKGLDFKTIKVASGGALEVLPNLEASGELSITKTEDKKYGLALSKGAFKTKKAIAGLNVDAKMVNFTYNEEAGIVGDTSNTTFSSSFFEVKAQGKVTFDSNGIQMPQVAAKFKGLQQGPITAMATNVAYTKEKGLSVEKITGELPKIGETVVTAEVNNIAIGDSFSVGAINVNFGTNKEISLAGGKIKVKLTETNVSVNEAGQWGFNVAGEMDVTAIPNSTATGKVTIGYDPKAGPTLKLENGEITSKINGFDVIAKDFAFNTNPGEKEKALTVKSVNVKGLETDNMKFNAQANGLSYGSEGFMGAMILSGAGNVELMKGVNLTGITGKLVKSKKGTEASVDASGQIRTNSFDGDLKKVGIKYAADGTKTFSYDGLSLTTKYFKLSSAKGTYSSDGNFALGTVKAEVVGLNQMGAANAKAEGVTYGKEGLKVGKFHAGIGWEGVNDVIAVDATNFNMPAEGAMSGDVKVTVPSNFSLGGGALQVEGLTSEVKLEEAGWNLSIGGKAKTTLPNSTASGDIAVGYSSQTGFKAELQNGAINADFPAYGLKIAAQGVSYDTTNKAIQIGTASVTVSKDKLKASQDLTGTVTDLDIKGKNINFKSIEIAAGGLQATPFSGVTLTADSAKLSKDDKGLDVSLKGGVVIDRTSPAKVKAEAKGEINYDTATKGISGKLERFTLNTSIFDTEISNAKFNSEGIHVDKATLNLSKSLDPAIMTKYIPGFQPWMLDFVKGVKFVAEDINYTSKLGLQIGKFYPDIPPIEFEIMGFKGVLDLKNQTGSLTGNKAISMKQDFPTLRVPIIAGVEATVSGGIYGSLDLSAGLTARKMQDYWSVGGSIGMKAAAGVKVELGIGINAVVASMTAKVGLDMGIKADGLASLQAGIRYNPEKKSVEMAPGVPLKFAYNLNSLLAAKVYAKLEYEALWGLFSGETVVDLAQWELGRLALSGESEAGDLSGLWAGLKNKAKLTGPSGNVLYER